LDANYRPHRQAIIDNRQAMAPARASGFTAAAGLAGSLDHAALTAGHE
jgi:hypothetical protein